MNDSRCSEPDWYEDGDQLRQPKHKESIHRLGVLRHGETVTIEALVWETSLWNVCLETFVTIFTTVWVITSLSNVRRAIMPSAICQSELSWDVTSWNLKLYPICQLVCQTRLKLFQSKKYFHSNRSPTHSLFRVWWPDAGAGLEDVEILENVGDSHQAESSQESQTNPVPEILRTLLRELLHP